MNDRKPILDRIAKLLRMADDVSSPNEAAIAARRAKKLMDEYNVTHADALSAELSLSDFIERNVGNPYRRFPGWMQSLAVAVARYSECQVKFEWHERGGKILRFQGEQTDLAIAEHLYTYLTQAIESLWRRTALPKRAQASFKRGAAAEIAAKLAEMKHQEREWFREPANSKALVVVNKKAAMLREQFGLVRYGTRRTTVADGGAYQSGQAAGRGIGIRRAINHSSGTRAITRQ